MKWIMVSPEVYFLLAAMALLVFSMIGKPDSKRDHLMALALSGLGIGFSMAAVWQDGLLFMNTYRVDLFSQVFKVLLSLGLFLVVCLCGELKDIGERKRRELFMLLFVCTLAMMLLVSAGHLLTMVVSLELSSYSLYVLVTLRRHEDMGVEAGIKYFLVGIFASAVMLFGIGLLYATTGTMFLKDLLLQVPRLMDQPLVLVGVLLTLGGFFFKLAVFPFHFWVADVYQGANNQVTAYIATVSKVAAIAILLRLVAFAGEGSTRFVQVLVGLSIASMTVGNLAAITQQDLKRLLGYSTVAHAGYVLIGVLSLSRDGYAGAVFYAMALLLMKFTAFLVVVKVAEDGGNVRVDQLAGLHRRSPLLALALMVALFGLAGIPPTIGFTGKFLVFVAAIERGYLALVLIAMVNVVVSLYYYLLVIRAAYLLEPREELPAITLAPGTRLLTLGLIVAMIAAGFSPYYLLELAQATVRVLL